MEGIEEEGEGEGECRMEDNNVKGRRVEGKSRKKRGERSSIIICSSTTSSSNKGKKTK